MLHVSVKPRNYTKNLSPSAYGNYGGFNGCTETDDCNRFPTWNKTKEGSMCTSKDDIKIMIFEQYNKGLVVIHSTLEYKLSFT